MRWKTLPLILYVCLPVNAQQDDPLAAFVVETAISDDVRVDAIKSFVIDRIPPFDPPESAAEWTEYAAELRVKYRDELVLRGVPEAWRSHEVRVEWTEDIETAHGYRIRKLRFEALPGLWVPALLYEPDEVTGKVPAVLNVNGHVGPPGKGSGYEQIRCINLAKRGMLALHPEWFACGELNTPDYAHSRLAYLDLVGISGLAPFHYLLERGLDILINDPRTDPERVAMTGLSGGGWQTTVFSAIDERVKVIVPNAGHSGVSIRIDDLRNMGDLEQVPVDLLTIADYSHITALFAPRPALLIYNAQDHCCFTAADALPTVYDPVRPVYELFGRTNDFQFHINEDPGTHNYEQDNRIQFYNFIERYFLPEEERFPEEIPSDDEVLPVEALTVGLPEDNATFRSLALAHAESAPRIEHASPEEAAAILRRVTRHAEISPEVTVLREGTVDGLAVTALSFATMFGPFYGVLVESSKETAEGVVVVRDAPLAESLEPIRALAEEHGSVLAIEPLFLGGNQPGGDNAWQYGMALQATGARILGIQAAQIAAAGRWLRDERRVIGRHLHARGPNSTTAARVAEVAAEYDHVFATVTIEDGLEDALQPVREAWDWAKFQGLFCFGLGVVGWD